MSDLAKIAARPTFYSQCHEGVTRAGEYQPCDKTAVALRRDPTEDDHPYPVCVYHVRSEMVPLLDVLRAGRPEAGR